MSRACSAAEFSSLTERASVRIPSKPMLLRENAFSKCDACGSTLMTFLDLKLHTTREWQCIQFRRGENRDEFNSMFGGTNRRR